MNNSILLILDKVARRDVGLFFGTRFTYNFKGDIFGKWAYSEYKGFVIQNFNSKSFTN